MVKIWGIPHNRRAKKFKNFIRVQAMKGGGYQAASWPRKGQYDKSPDGYERSRLFGLIQHWTTRPFWWEQLDALNLSVGTPYLPRDILTKSAYGTLTYLKFKDGTTMFPQKVMSQEIQAQLDTISTEPGALLVRTTNEWVALSPGPSNTVLTAHGPSVLPSWLAPPSGGGGLVWSIPPGLENDTTSATRCKALDMWPFQSFTLKRFAFWSKMTSTFSVKVVLFEHNGTQITAVLGVTDPYENLPSGSHMITLDVPEGFGLEAERRYGLGLELVTPGSGAAFSMATASDRPLALPIYPYGGVVTTSAPIEVGSSITETVDFHYWFALQAQGAR